MRRNFWITIFASLLILSFAVNAAEDRFSKDVRKLIGKVSKKIDWTTESVAVGLGPFYYGNSGMSSDFAYHFASEVKTSATDAANLRLIARRELSAILEEQDVQMTDLIDPKTAKRIGKIKGLDAMLTGSYATGWGDKVRIEVNLIHIEIGDMLSENATVDSIPDSVAIEPPDYKAQKKRADEKIKDLLPERQNVADKKSNSDFRITIEPDRGPGGLYRKGEKLTLFVKSDVDCYIEVYDIAPDGSTTLIFPNQYWAEHHSSNKISAGVRQKLPHDDSFKLGIAGPSFGIETLKVIASTKPFEEVSRSIYDSRGAYPDMGNIDDDATVETLKLRSRNVVAEPGTAASKRVKVAQAQCTIITKP